MYDAHAVFLGVGLFLLGGTAFCALVVRQHLRERQLYEMGFKHALKMLRLGKNPFELSREYNGEGAYDKGVRRGCVWYTTGED